MALRDKLGKLSEEIKTEKQIAKENEQNESLKPLRALIKKLGKEKLDLEMIKNSLDFKNERDPENNQGMKDYAEDTAVGAKKTREQLEEAAAENSEALEQLGVKSIDDLAANSEFAEEEEVVAYKKAKNKEEDLRLSDTKLKNRLAKLGIEMNDENFSYEAASKEIGQRLENLEKELTAEKLKTPEGTTEIVDNLAEEFSKNTKNIFWSGSAIIDKEAQRRSGREASENSYHEFNLSEKRDYRGDHFRVEFVDDNKSKIDNYHSLPILPKNFNEQVDKYGLEITEAALKENYAKKVDDAFMGPNAPLGKPTQIKKIVESFSPENEGLTEEKLRSFDAKKQEVLNLLKTKSKELEDKGIEFNARGDFSYGISYNQLFSFNKTLGNITAQLERDNLHNPDAARSPRAQDIIRDYADKEYEYKAGSVFHPLDFNKLSDLAERRIKELNQAIKIINNINDEASANNFLGKGLRKRNMIGPDAWKGRDVERFHDQLLSTKELRDIPFVFPENITHEEGKQLIEKFKSYPKSIRDLNKEIAEAEEAKRRTSEKMDELVDYNVMMYKLSRKNKSRYLLEDSKFTRPDNYDYRLRDLSDYIENIKRERDRASSMMSEIAGLKTKLNSEDEVLVNGVNIEVKAKTEEYKRLSEEMNKKEKEISDKKFELNKEKNSEPWLGKDKWRAKVANLENDVKKLEQENIDLKTSYDQNVKEAFHYLNKEKMSWGGQTKAMIENYRASGKVGEVFGELEKNLMELVDRKVPEEVQRDFDKLSDLEERLQGKK